MEHLLLQESCRHFHYMESIGSDRNSGPDGPFSSELHTEVPWQRAACQGMPLQTKETHRGKALQRGPRKIKCIRVCSFPPLLHSSRASGCLTPATSKLHRQTGFEHQAWSTQAGPLKNKRLKECTSPLTAYCYQVTPFWGAGGAIKGFLSIFLSRQHVFHLY